MKVRTLAAVAAVVVLVLAAASLAPSSPARAAETGVPQGPSLPNAGAREIGHGFATAATPPMDFDRFTCTFVVPGLPTSNDGQSVFPWCGVGQDSGVGTTGDTSFGILQPVLMYGGDCVSGMPGVPVGSPADPNYAADPYWYYSAQYVYPQPVGSLDYTCTTGPGFRAEPGDVLVSVFTFDHVADSMTVEISEQDGSGSSTLVVAHPWDDAGASWLSFQGQFLLQAVIEAWNVSIPDGWPASPSLWPVEMTYEGSQADQFLVEPWDNGVPPISCEVPTVAGDEAATTCTFDFTSLQPPPTSTTSTSAPASAAASEVAPSFTG